MSANASGCVSHRRAPLCASVRACLLAVHFAQGTISSKQYGSEDLVTNLVSRACIDVCPKNPKNFNVENVRVCKASWLVCAVVQPPE